MEGRLPTWFSAKLQLGEQHWGATTMKVRQSEGAIVVNLLHTLQGRSIPGTSHKCIPIVTALHCWRQELLFPSRTHELSLGHPTLSRSPQPSWASPPLIPCSSQLAEQYLLSLAEHHTPDLSFAAEGPQRILLHRGLGTEIAWYLKCCLFQ